MAKACNSCEILYINGIRTHESGCPEAWKEEERSCKWCGTPFIPEERHQECCGHTCHVAYHNVPCDCSECNPEEESEAL
jgi:hypothetical protein